MPVRGIQGAQRHEAATRWYEQHAAASIAAVRAAGWRARDEWIPTPGTLATHDPEPLETT